MSDGKGGDRRKMRYIRKRTYGSATINFAYNSHRSSAKGRGCEPLSRNEWENLAFLPCHYCGDIDTRNITKSSTYKKRRGTTLDQESVLKYDVKINGIDRIDSSRCYTKDNCVPCCRQCNSMKLDYSQENFYEKVEKIYNNWRKQEDTTLEN